MAFELPDHLPKGGFHRDKGIQILNKLGQTSFQQLNADLVVSWVGELDSAIKETKNSISDRIRQDLPEFERLYQSSVDVQTKLYEITRTVNSLEENLQFPSSGVLPQFAQTLTSFSTKERLALEAEVTHNAYRQLYHLCLQLQKLQLHMDRGELPESMQVCYELDSSIVAASTPLQNANIMLDIKKRFRLLRDHIQEQLSNAYDRCVSFSDQTKLQIHQRTIVSPQSIQISLSDVLSSLSSDALSGKLTSFRRELSVKIVEPILLSSHVASTSKTDSSVIFSAVLSSQPTSPVQSLRLLSHFLQSHLLPHLPQNQVGFPELLLTSLGLSLLTKFLQPSIPPSLSAVPAYLSTLNEAISFENEYMSFLIASSGHKKRQIQEWGDEIETHYEKKRREMFLEKTRGVIASRSDNATFRVEIIVERTVSTPLLSVSTASSVSTPFKKPETEVEETESSNWEFNDDETERNGIDNESQTLAVEPNSSDKINEDENVSAEDSWGWGDDEPVEEDPETEAALEPHDCLQAESAEERAHSDDLGAEFSNQEEEDFDPWDDDPWAAPENTHSEPKPSIPIPTIVSPIVGKAATRLEKFSAKSKSQSQTHSGGSRTVPTHSQAISDPSRLSTVQTQVSSASSTLKNGKPNKVLLNSASRKQDVFPPTKESYLVTLQARRILEIAGEVLREGKEMLQTNVFSSIHQQQSDKDKLGQLLLSTASSIIDLYRALYPISQAPLLSKDVTQYMQWHNDCLFLSTEMSNFKFPLDGNLKNEKWLEAQERTRVLGECCFEDAILRTQQVIHALLGEAGGFSNVSEDDQYVKCKDVIFRILDELEDTSRKWKKILSKHQYFISAGRIVEDTLYRFMDEIISLQDIPQKDSEYISEFCEMLEKLDELFVYSSGEQSVVGLHVPIWFKFSYFSWLIKGSIADISYMFDQGHLVDYEIDELVRLLRALFADTPLRESTIQNFLKGHPDTEMQY